MLITDYIKEDSINKAVDLSQIGINELAWGCIDIFRVLEELVDRNTIILGGDVFYDKNNKINHTYDNWYYNGNNSQESFNQAKNYITNYCLKNGEDYYFSIIVK